MARTRYGSTSTSSLLSASRAGQNKLTAYNNAVADYTYSMSAKTADDLKTLRDYYSPKLTYYEANDPSQALTIRKTLDSAQKSYTSNEIQRNTLGVLYGTKSNTDKYHAIATLRDQALANGDQDQALSLETQMATLSKTIQNEATSAAKQQAAGATAGVTQAINDLKTLKEQGKIDPVNYYTRLSTLLSNKMDDTTKESAKSALANDKDYQIATNGVLMDKIARGEVPFEATIDSNGVHDFRNANTLAAGAVKNADGSVARDANGTALVAHTTDMSSDFSTGATPSGNQSMVHSFSYMKKVIDPTTGAVHMVPQVIDKSSGRLGFDQGLGLTYMIDENGDRRYIGQDASNGYNIMSKDPQVLLDGNTKGTNQPKLNPVEAGAKGAMDWYHNYEASIGGDKGQAPLHAMTDTAKFIKDHAGNLPLGGIASDLFGSLGGLGRIADLGKSADQIRTDIAANNAKSIAANRAAMAQASAVLAARPAPTAGAPANTVASNAVFQNPVNDQQRQINTTNQINKIAGGVLGTMSPTTLPVSSPAPAPKPSLLGSIGNFFKGITW